MKLLVLSLLAVGAFAAPRKPSDTAGTWRIVGGQMATHGNFPYQLSVQTAGGNHYCGASILDENTFICAAHCNVFDIDQVAAGKQDLRVTEPQEQIIQVSTTTNHESYNSNTFENDIALIKGESSLSFDDYVSAVKLPATQDEEVAHGTMCTVSGWGDVQAGGENPPNLYYAAVPVVDDQTCNTYGYPNNIVPSMLCAGEREGGVDSCQGDSGGPLVLGEGSGSFAGAEQVGIVSWGFSCAAPTFPGVYTQVSYYLDWIGANR